MADMKLMFALAVAVLSVFALNVNGEYRFVKAKKTWHEAEKDCVKWGGHLAYINSEAESKYVQKEIKKRGLGNTWNGLNDIRCEGKWTYPIQYSNWNRNEPNGKRNENCAHMYTNTGLWNDANCKSKFPSVCQIAPGKYLFNAVKMTRDVAYKHCMFKLGGRLACIESASENKKILAALKKRRFGNTWINFDDKYCEGNWECSGSWGNWIKGEPNGKRKENCIMMMSSANGRWNDMPCGSKASYVCQKGESWTIATPTTWTTTTKVVYKWIPGDEQKAKIEEQAKDVPQEKPEVEEAKEDDKEE